MALCSTSYLATAILPLNSAQYADIAVPDKAPQYANPASMLREIAVELVGDGVELPQSRPWNSGQIVVLVVETDVVGQDVQRAVVGVRLGSRLLASYEQFSTSSVKYVVLGNEVAGTRVEGAGEY